MNLDPQWKFEPTDVIADNWDLVTRLAERCHGIAETILLKMCTAFNPAEAKAMIDFHDPAAITNSLLGFNKIPHAPPEEQNIGHGAHTDIGSLTVLFAPTPGLQVMDPELGDWVDMPPRPWHAVINVGDSLKYMSRGKFRSALHRVVPAPEIIAAKDDRYSLVYFFRPSRTMTFRDGDGNELTSSQWHRKKTEAFRLDHHEQKMTTVITGTKGDSGTWGQATQAPGQPLTSHA